MAEVRTIEQAETARCRDCIFWHSAMGNIGECRRYPPKREYADEQERGTTTGIGYYVMTGREDWCGEFIRIIWQ